MQVVTAATAVSVRNEFSKFSVSTPETKMVSLLKPKSSSALHPSLRRYLKEIPQLNWDYPNPFEKICKRLNKGELEELTSKSAKAEFGLGIILATSNPDIFDYECNRFFNKPPKILQGFLSFQCLKYQICTDNRPPHKIILQKPRYEQEKYVNDLAYLQPSCTPMFLKKP